MTISEQLCRNALQISNEEIPDSAYDAGAKLLLDALGCAIAGRTMPGIAATVDMVADWGGKAEASILLSGRKYPLPSAVFVNGAMVHALDYDDVYLPGTLHLTSTMVPVMLAVAEKTGASGQDALGALVMGPETACRLGKAERAGRRGEAFLPSSLVNGFGAVVTAARLYGMSSAQCADAMGINYAQASGNRQALLDMTLTKRLQPALAGRSAIWAVELARRGVTGPRNVFEGEAGYCQSYLDGTSLAVEELEFHENDYQTELVSIKRYPSCGACHNVQIAAERLVSESKLKADDVEKVEIFNLGPGGLVGNPFKLGENPQVDAQFSVLWAVAQTIVRGPATLADYTDEKVGADTDVLDFIEKISFVKAPDDLPPEPSCPRGFSAYNGRYQGLVVHTKDGRMLRSEQAPIQTFDPRNHGFAEVAEKFRLCVAFAGFDDGNKVDRIIDTVKNLRRENSVDGLITQLNELR